MRSIADIKITTKMATAFVSLAAVTLGVGALSYVRLAQIEKNIRWTEHTYQVLQTLDGINMAMLNRETAVRGYLIAGDAKFLAPYKGGEAEFQKNSDRVKELTADNPAQQARLATLRQRAET